MVHSHIKFSQTFSKLICSVITVLFAVTVVWYYYLAGFTTTAMNYSERSWLLGDSYPLNCIFSAAIIFTGFILYYYHAGFRQFISRINTDSLYSKHWRQMILAAAGAASVAFIITFQKNATADQATVCIVADQWLDHDFSSMQNGGYLCSYPHQIGLVLFLYLLGHLAGSYNYLLFQLINAAALAAIIKTFGDLSDLCGNTPMTSLTIMASSALFLPAFLYTTFVYGTLIGLACSLLAARNILLFTRSLRKQNALFAILESFLAVTFKSNYMIFLIANILFLILLLLRNHSLRPATLLPFLIAVLLLYRIPADTAAQKVTGIPVSSGASYWSYIAMGLQENDETWDGWYNGYNINTYASHNYNQEEQAEEARQYIKTRLRQFREDPQAAVRFFSGKNASQWNNPDFQGFWINTLMGSSVQYSWIMNYLMSVDFSSLVRNLENILQFLTITGLILYLIFQKTKTDLFAADAAAFLGGFTFHTFWEAKAQYTWPYFMILIPFSVSGCLAFYRVTASFIKSGRKAEDALTPQQQSATGNVKLPVTGLLCLFIIVPVIISTKKIVTLNSLFLPAEDNAGYLTDFSRNSFFAPSRLDDGYYRVRSSLDGSGFRTGAADVSDANAAALTFCSPSYGNDIYLRFSEYNRRCMVFLNDTQCLDVPSGSGSEGELVRVYTANRTPAQKWALRRASGADDFYILSQSGLALTWNPDQQTFTLQLPDSDSKGQIWHIEAADQPDSVLPAPQQDLSVRPISHVVTFPANLARILTNVRNTST